MSVALSSPEGAPPVLSFAEPAEALAAYPIGTRIHVAVWSDTPPAVLDELRRLPGASWIRRGRILSLPAHGWCYLAYAHPDPGIRWLVQQMRVVHVDRPDPVPPAHPLQELLNSEFRRSVFDGVGRDGHPSFDVYQRALVDFAGRRNGGSAWMSPGSGKSRATLAWGLLLPVTPTHPAGLLVVTPASVRIQWATEAVACADIQPWISDPDLAQRRAWSPPLEYTSDCLATGRRPVYVVGWEELARLYYGDAAHEGRAGERRSRRKGGDDASGRHGFLAELIRWKVITSVIWDEAQYGKSPKRFRWITPVAEAIAGAPPVARPTTRRRRVSRGNTAAAAQEIAEHVPRRLASTGTPASKDVLDFWGSLTLVEPRDWGGRKQFGVYHCGATPTTYDIELPKDLRLGRGRPQEAAVGLLSQSGLLQGLRFRLGVVAASQAPPAWGSVYVVRQSESHAHLPPKRRRVSYVSSSEFDKVTADDLEACLKSSPGEDELLLPRGQEALVVMTALMKTSHMARRAAETLLEGGKVCVLTARQRHVDRLVAAIGKAAPGTRLWGLHGGNSTANERNEIRLEYLAAPRGGAGVCVVGTGATIGTGLNWHDTDRGILAMVPTTPAQLIQYENRWYRLGLEHPIEVLIPVALGTTDRLAIATLRARLVEAGEVLDDPGLAEAADQLLGTDTPEELLAMMKATTAAIAERQVRVEAILATAFAEIEKEPFWL